MNKNIGGKPVACRYIGLKKVLVKMESQTEETEKD
jgi:hypothetical protein